jgi:hypothetical protein
MRYHQRASWMRKISIMLLHSVEIHFEEEAPEILATGTRDENFALAVVGLSDDESLTWPIYSWHSTKKSESLPVKL